MSHRTQEAALLDGPRLPHSPKLRSWRDPRPRVRWASDSSLAPSTTGGLGAHGWPGLPSQCGRRASSAVPGERRALSSTRESSGAPLWWRGTSRTAAPTSAVRADPWPGRCRSGERRSIRRCPHLESDTPAGEESKQASKQASNVGAHESSLEPPRDA
eukprot:scaffold2923_cov313-Pinguiococcus_pyrenoidosus.AAC.18